MTTLGELAQRTMADARFAGTEGFSSVPVKLNELAVLMAARAWSSPYVWEAHDRYAVRVGLPPALVDAIRTSSPPPSGLEPDVAAVYTFVEEFLRTRQVSDATFATARTALGGDRALVDLIAVEVYERLNLLLKPASRGRRAVGQTPASTGLLGVIILWRADEHRRLGGLVG